ncbi:guanylate kinase-like [Onthophagus taurus]|uniref:guanylate kinase-like n=1 Tax=Onthophagus taurus TaxID=166361 RepID=UPI0039BEAF34
MASTKTKSRPLVLCGPSGSGKSTFLSKLMTDFPNRFGFSVSHTTRKPRPGEKEGDHYHFTDRESIKKAIDAGDFIESAEFSGNIYGTSKKAVETVCEKGKICILDIDIQGVKQVRNTHLQPWYIFLMPPSLEVLENRLKSRNTETEKSLKLRLETAAKEIEYGTTPGNFDFIVINDNLEHAYSQLKGFIEGNVLKEENNINDVQIA